MIEMYEAINSYVDPRICLKDPHRPSIKDLLRGQPCAAKTRFLSFMYLNTLI